MHFIIVITHKHDVTEQHYVQTRIVIMINNKNNIQYYIITIIITSACVHTTHGG